jgi:hypothetical protein
MFLLPVLQVKDWPLTNRKCSRNNQTARNHNDICNIAGRLAQTLGLILFFTQFPKVIETWSVEGENLPYFMFPSFTNGS